MNAQELLRLAVEKNASDIFIGAGRYVSFKIKGEITTIGDKIVSPTEADELVSGLYALANRPIEGFRKACDDDFPITVPKLARFRVSAYSQRGTLAAVIRVVLFDLPNYQSLGIPDQVMGIADEKNGLVLVTGPTASGKTTTLACIIDAINQTKKTHIITLEDPIEFLHRDKMSLISQREISTDTQSYLVALRACLRQTPDIILLGEMRDMETIKTAMTAAETGHLVISTLHTVSAANTVERIIDTFPHEQQAQMRTQLAMILRSVVSQQLVESKDGGLAAAFEIMQVNKEISELIRTSKTHEITSTINASSPRMISMDNSLMKLVQERKITMEVAVANATDPVNMETLFRSKFYDEFRTTPLVRNEEAFY
jgi:twitching motility protein PilT